MDNQHNLPGTPLPGNDIRVQNAGATSGNTAASRIGASNTESPAVSPPASGRKSAGSPAAQDATGANQGPANSSSANEGQPTNDKEGTLLDTALESGKKWIEDSGVLNSVNQFPKSFKEFSDRAVARVGDLTTTQKVVGGALLAVGLGWLATRKVKSLGSSPADDAPRGGSNFGRRNYGYQAPDASASRSNTAARKDSGSPYGNSRATSNYGSGSNYTSGASSPATSANTGINSGSGRANSSSGSGSSSANDTGARTAESSYRPKNDDFRSIE